MKMFPCVCLWERHDAFDPLFSCSLCILTSLFERFLKVTHRASEMRDAPRCEMRRKEQKKVGCCSECFLRKLLCVVEKKSYSRSIFANFHLGKLFDFGSFLGGT